jgi:WD40 repeat protein
VYLNQIGGWKCKCGIEYNDEINKCEKCSTINKISQIPYSTLTEIGNYLGNSNLTCFNNTDRHINKAITQDLKDRWEQFTNLTCVATLEHDQNRWINSIAFHPIFSLLITSGSNTVKLWHFPSNTVQPKCVYSIENGSNTVAFHPKLPIFGIGINEHVKLFNVSFDGNSSELCSSAFRQDNSANAPLSGRISQTNVATITDIAQIAMAQSTANVMSIAFHPSYPLMITGSSRNIVQIWYLDLDNPTKLLPTCIATLDHKYALKSVAFHPKLLLFATGTMDMFSYTTNCATLWSFSFSPDIPLQTCTSKPTCIASLDHNSEVSSVAFHPCMPLLATSGKTTTKLWHILSEQSPPNCVATIEHTSYVRSSAFNPDGPFMATSLSDNTVNLWLLNFNRSNEVTPTCIATLEGHTASVNTVAFHPNLPCLATGSSDSTVKVWASNSIK